MNLQKGKIYNFQKVEKDGVKIRKYRKRMRLIRKYPHHALFVREAGIRECFTYWEIRQILRGQAI